MMRREFAAKLAVLAMGIGLVGCAGGYGLAGYTTSGTVAFYRQSHVSKWTPPPSDIAAVEIRDLLFEPGERGTASRAAFEPNSDD